jgi:hypothetical protein
MIPHQDHAHDNLVRALCHMPSPNINHTCLPADAGFGGAQSTDVYCGTFMRKAANPGPLVVPVSELNGSVIVTATCCLPKPIP